MHEFFAEFWGTFILIAFGLGSVAQFSFMKTGVQSFLSINFGFGLGCAMGVYWSAGISGGHINPSVTLALAVSGRFPWKKLPVYWLAQSLGALVASAVIYGVYYELLTLNGGATMATAGVWSTYLANGVSNATGFGDQLVATTILVSTIFALIDKRNASPSNNMAPFVIGMLVTVIGISFGANAGYGVNPARDFIPRLFTAMAGWGGKPFEYSDYYFWVPVLGQLLGGVLGAMIYIFFIEMHHEEERPDRKESLVANIEEEVEKEAENKV